MNKSFIIGRLTKDPEARATQSGISKSSFTVAVDRRYKNQQGERETDFLNVVAWRGLADLCNRYLHKGSKVAVSGSIQTRNYEDKDGIKRYITEIVADEVEFLTPKRGESAPEGFVELDDSDEELPF
jgi:single-strand DNA-binding protein